MAEFVNGKYTSPSGRVYDEAEEKKRAQQYAQRALEGKGPGGYVPTSLSANAIMNAYPITEDRSDDNSSGDVTTASNGGDMMSRYLSELERQRAEKQAALDAQYRQGKKNIEDSAADSNKDAYTAYMHGIKNMPQKSAMYGSGGMAQSLANKSQLNYENNRNNIAVAKQQALADLESDYRAGVLDAGDDYLTKLTAAQGKITTQNKTVSGGGTGTTGAAGTKSYKIGNTGIKADSEMSLYNQLIAMGFTRKEAEDYMLRNGVITA